MLYEEGFESAPGVPTLPSYRGATGATYTADPYWLDTTSCNGFVSASTSTPPAGYCQNYGGGNEFPSVGAKDAALGLLHSPQDPATNHALSSNTSPQVLGQTIIPDQIQFATASQLSLPSADGRFITFSVNAAATSCQGPPLLRFYYRDASGAEIPVSSSAINPCSDPGMLTDPASGARYGRFAANGSTLLSGASVGIVMRNESTEPPQSGNDGAIDDIRVLDVTPRLDKQFSPATVETGGVSTLTFRVTNTSELSAKTGWSFTDDLPAGLTIANPTGLGGTCAATSSASAGGTSIAVTDGDLAAGETSCTVTVQVTSSQVGSYTNGPGNVSVVGLIPPGDTTVTFSDPAYTVAKMASAAVANPGDTVTYTVAVTNTGAWPYDSSSPAPFTAASFRDDLSSVLDDATYNGDASDGTALTGDTLSWSGPLAVGETKTITYSVTVNVPDTGDKVLTNAVIPTGPGGSCVTADRCTTDTNVTAPGLSLVKSVDASSVSVPAVVGDVLTYRFVETNTGTATLTGVAISDALPGLSELSYSWPGPEGVLAPGESVMAVATYRVTQADIDGGHRGNTATGEGTPSSGPAITPPPSSTDTPLVSAMALPRVSG